MKYFLALATFVLLLFSSCSTQTQSTTPPLEVIKEVGVTDLCTPVSNQYYTASIEFATNSIKSTLYIIEPRNNSIRSCDEFSDQSWSSRLDYHEVATNTYNDFTALREDVDVSNIFLVVSQGFQNIHDVDALREAITQVFVSGDYVPELHLITGEQEAKMEWLSLTQANPNIITIGSGGGSTQIGWSGTGFSIPVGSKISEGTDRMGIDRVIMANQPKKLMSHKDIISITGGANYLALWHGLGRKPETGINYSVRDLEEGLRIISDPELYEAKKEARGIPDFGISRYGMEMSVYTTIQYIRLIGIERIHLAPRASWTPNYVLRNSIQSGFSKAG